MHTGIVMKVVCFQCYYEPTCMGYILCCGLGCLIHRSFATMMDNLKETNSLLPTPILFLIPILTLTLTVTNNGR